MAIAFGVVPTDMGAETSVRGDDTFILNERGLIAVFAGVVKYIGAVAVASGTLVVILFGDEYSWLVTGTVPKSTELFSGVVS